MVFFRGGVIFSLVSPTKLSFPLCRCILVCMVVAMFQCLPRAAVAAPVDYLVDDWDTENNLPSSTVTSMEQTADGYLWIGTQNGLVRFDGVRFVPYIPPTGRPLSSGIFSLLAGTDGSLWIGTSTNLAHLQNGNLTDYLGADGRVNSVVQSHDGRIWITRSRVRDDKGPLCEVKGTELRCYGKADGIPSPYAVPLAEDSEGNLWIGSVNLLIRWRAGSSKIFTPSKERGGEGLSGIKPLRPTRTVRSGAEWTDADPGKVCSGGYMAFGSPSTRH